MRWLVTGSAGQLGRTLADLLMKQGKDYLAASRDALDISDRIEVRKLLGSFKPNIVINCAAWTDVDGAESNQECATATNAVAVGRLAEATKNLGVRFIHISTDFVFGGNQQELYSETDPPSPVNHYGRSKAQGEQMALAANPATVILRASWLYSQYGKNFPKAIIRKLLIEDLPISVVDDQIGQPTSCLSLSNTIFELAKRKELSGIFHGSTQGETSRYLFAKAIAAAIGEDPDRITPMASRSLNLAADRPSNSLLSHSRLIDAGIALPQYWQDDFASQAKVIKDQVESEL
jgi:dTDP-4-dehydrorhamnose reductase